MMGGNDFRSDVQTGTARAAVGYGVAGSGLLTTATQAIAVPPPSPHSLSGALQRLNNAITTNAEMIHGVAERLETVGVLRPSRPEGQSAEKNGVGPDSQLAALLSACANSIEQHNARLLDLAQRIDG